MQFDLLSDLHSRKQSKDESAPNVLAREWFVFHALPSKATVKTSRVLEARAREIRGLFHARDQNTNFSRIWHYK